MLECRLDELSSWGTTCLQTTPIFCKESVKAGPIYVSKNQRANKQKSKKEHIKN